MKLDDLRLSYYPSNYKGASTPLPVDSSKMSKVYMTDYRAMVRELEHRKRQLGAQQAPHSRMLQQRFADQMSKASTMSLSGIGLAIFEGEDFKTVSGWRCDSVEERLPTCVRSSVQSHVQKKQNKN